MKKLLISLFDHSGNASKPYRDSGEWEVIQIDIKNGIDILTWDYESDFHKIRFKLEHEAINRGRALIGQTYEIETGIICMVSCTDFALSGSKHFKRKDGDGSTDLSNLLVAKSKEIIEWFEKNTKLLFWQLENPMSRIHTLNPWLGKPILKFNPCDYANYLSLTNADLLELERLRTVDTEDLTKIDEDFILNKVNAYNKMTWIWGKFNIPKKDGVLPVYKKTQAGSLWAVNRNVQKNFAVLLRWDFVMLFINLIINGKIQYFRTSESNSFRRNINY